MATDQMKMPEPSEHTGWILAAMASAVVAMWAVLKKLVSIQDKRNRDDIDELKADRERRRKAEAEMRKEIADQRLKTEDHRLKLDDCLQDREELRVMCTEMKSELQSIRQTGDETHDAVERIDIRHDSEDAKKDGQNW